MLIYYRGPDAFITDDKFVWLHDTPRIVPVRALRDVQLVEQAARTRFADTFRIAGGGLAVFAVAGWFTAGPMVGATLAILAVSAMLVAVRSRQILGAKNYRVVANLSGARATIYESRDVRVFHQVTRALRRSVENGRRDHSDYRLAPAS
ncbi:DUF6232 family protein [Actinoplanes sp. NPDC049265]|uniref:DUF6232 family protein n=1 Tax=Actinoplanes sp. NPDC049265 TaxID=3363902 RepID=UPI0037111EB1